jgi:hypothetical protein
MKTYCKDLFMPTLNKISHGFARMGTDKDREMGIFLWLDFYIRVHP